MNPLLFIIGCLLIVAPQGLLPNYHLINRIITEEQSYRVVLSEESKLSILGRTNVNQFQCKYTQSIEPDILEVNVRSEEGNLVFSNAFIRLQTINFKCGPSQMNQDLQEFLKVKQHPTATIQLMKLNISKEKIVDSYLQQAMAEMEITLAGITRKYAIPVSISKNGEEHMLNGCLDLTICDFNLDPPVVMMGLIRVKEEVTVNFSLKASIEKSIIH